MPVQSPGEQRARPAGVAAAPPASHQRHLLHTPRARRRCFWKILQGGGGKMASLCTPSLRKFSPQPPAPLCSALTAWETQAGREARWGGGTTGEESVTKLLPRSAICPSLFHGQWEQLNVRESTRRRERSHRPRVGEDGRRRP